MNRNGVLYVMNNSSVIIVYFVLIVICSQVDYNEICVVQH